MNYENFNDKQKLIIDISRKWILDNRQNIKKCDCENCANGNAILNINGLFLSNIVYKICALNFLSKSELDEIDNFFEEKNWFLV